MAETTSGTWDETIYLALGRSLLSGDRRALADLGVAPLQVALYGRAASSSSIPGASGRLLGLSRTNPPRARACAVQWFAIPCVVGVFALVGITRGI